MSFHNQALNVFIFANKMRATFIYLLNSKIFTLTAFVIKKNNLNSLINMVSTDMNLI